MDIASAIEHILSRCPRRVTDTVDTIKHGDPRQELRGIACCFTPTRAVIDAAARLGANLIIAHEPTWWTHPDGLDWLQDDPVRAAKAAALDANRQVVWRLHDQVHGPWPDVIEQGVLAALGWSDAADPGAEHIVRLAPTTLRGLIGHLKERLGAQRVRHTGDPDMPVRTVGLTPGAGAWTTQRAILLRDDVDVMIIGECSEWEFAEYARDSATVRPRVVVALGHCTSEDAGVAAVASLVRQALPGVPVAHLQSGAPYGFM
jgi:putative NIF3 family GTP cyclohydrolase 1 type 2